MANNFFYRQSDISQDDLNKFNTIVRNNAYVVVKSKDSDFRLPIPDKGFAETYNPNGTGRAAPVLKDVSISLEGEAASLRRANVSFTCFDRTSFDIAEAAFLRPGAEITIEYGYVGPETPAEKGEYDFRVYDFTFKLNKQHYFECSLKAVSAGTGAEFDLIDINGPQQFLPLKLNFITNYNGITEQSKVRNLFDFMDYQIQKGCNELGTGYYGSNSFNPENGSNGPCTNGGHWAVITAPRKYEPEGKMKVGFLTPDRILYLTLEAIVEIINAHILKENENGYQIKFEKNWSSIQYKHAAGRIFSPTPSDVLFPYAKDTLENKYGDDKISIDNLYDAKQTAIADFRIDKSESAGDPKGILISRDVIRGIQSEFNQQAMDEDDSTEEKDKSKSTIPLIKFFKKIFAVIRENSGGDWDLSLEKSEKNVASEGTSSDADGTIWIVNKKAPFIGTEKPKPLEFIPQEGRNGIRELTIEGSVPKDVQAEAFGGAPELSTVKAVADIVAEKLEEDTEAFKKERKELQEELPEAQDDLDSGNYGSDVTSAAKGLIKRLVQNVLPTESAKTGKLLSPVPWPLSFKLVIDGIEGLRFGDTISCAYLPGRYKKESGVRVVFTITQYTHTISGNDWKTEITAVSRIVGD